MKNKTVTASLSWSYFILFFGFLFASCSLTKEPEYKSYNSFEVKNFNSKTVDVSANLLFYNPNSVGVKLSSNKLLLYVSGKYVGTADLLPFEAKAKSEFQIPLTATFATSKLTDTGVLSSALKYLGGKPVPIQIKGDLIFDVKGIKFTKAIDIQKDLTLD
ncbi:MAG: hypothetical protein C4K58_07470 [Flavobacteriaceae bacterium]|nr:MAG: hypothetical protein C4K58_07470 [Flavobacteriaceae bacterium]